MKKITVNNYFCAVWLKGFVPEKHTWIKKSNFRIEKYTLIELPKRNNFNL